MKRFAAVALSIAVLAGSSSLVRAADPISPAEMQAGFHTPPVSAKSLTFWMWMNGCVSKEGITADLESFARVGLAGTQQFLIGGAEADLDDPSLVFLSDRWRGLEKFAETESARLGLDFGTHNCAGWSSSGGPWITPAQSMQKVIYAETTFKGPGKFEGKLPTGQIARGYYGDIAVLAFQTAPYTGPAPARGLPAGATGQPPVGTGRGTPIGVISKDSIINLTEKMAADGTLSWEAPAGDWVIVRLGHTTTGKTNVAGPTPATGLECDKMSKEALDAHYAAYPEMLLADAGKLAGTTFKRFEIDSYESGPQDWTPKMREEFQKRRGYDMLPYLAYMTRRNIIINGVDVSDRFKEDYNLTIAELYAENYYGHLQELIHRTPGLQFMYEPYNTSQFSPMNTLNLCKYGDIITAEFWQRPSTWGWNCIKTVSSGAHTWGKNIVAAESFTGQPNFAFQSDPYMLKASGDRAYALGVNKLVYHTSAMQPWLNAAPGMTMGQFGTHFGRTITWWEHGAKEWISYQARAQFLLQQGTPTGDLCFLQYDRRDPKIPEGYDGDNIGSEIILTQMTVQNGRLTLPSGVSYAAIVLPELKTIDPQLLRKLQQLVNDGGALIGPKPTASSTLTNYPKCEDDITTMAAALWGDTDGVAKTEHTFGKGHVFWGVRPDAALTTLGITPDLQFTTAARPSPLVWIHRRLNDGDMYFISNQSDAAVQAQASFRIAGKIPELWHAETESVEQAPIWEPQEERTGIPLSLDPSGSVFVIFRQPKAAADPVVAMTRDGQPAGDAHLKMLAAPQSGLSLTTGQPGSYAFTTAGGKVLAAKVDALPAAVDLSANWEVRFPPKLGAPDKISLDKLMNLSEHATAGVKYFSGTATYARDFDVPESLLAKGRVLTLDLGTVKNVAEVRVNDHDLPLMWLPPFRQDITSSLKPGRNTVEIKITNLWINRLIGDEQLPEDLNWGPLKMLGSIRSGNPLLTVPDWINNPATRPSKDRVTFSTFKFFTKESPLPPSGLIGPVMLQSAQQVAVTP